jgi:hypothetical protein
MFAKLFQFCNNSPRCRCSLTRLLHILKFITKNTISNDICKYICVYIYIYYIYNDARRILLSNLNPYKWAVEGGEWS